MSTFKSVLNERSKTHGSFEVNTIITQSLKEIMRTSPNWSLLGAPQQEALDMIMHKTARLLTGDILYIDSVRDIIGYAQLMQDWMEKQAGATDVKVHKVTLENGVWSEVV